MNISEYIMKNSLSNSKKSPGYSGVDRIVCHDDFSISIQAGAYLYSAPRRNEGPWTAVECGYPSSKPDLIMGYAEDPDNPTNTVYGYVPVELVEQLIASHGGSKQLEE